MVRRRLLVNPTGKFRPDTADDYVIHVTTKFSTAGRFFGELSLVRTLERSPRKRYVDESSLYTSAALHLVGWPRRHSVRPLSLIHI